MTLLIATLLAQVISDTGFKSTAEMSLSGAPDYICGNGDDQPDGGAGIYSRYCVLLTQESSSYSGYHGDLTIIGSHPRSAGWLLFVSNNYWGSGFPVLAVDWRGNVESHGSYYASGNGGGLYNSESYAIVSGNSSDATLVPDVLIAPKTPHSNKGWNFGVWNGATYPFRVRDDGAISVGDTVLSVRANPDALFLTQELPDGGARVAIVRWSQ